MERVVGVSDMLLSTDPDDVLVTYALGSCVGLALFDPEAGAGALLHSMLPVSRLDEQRAVREPYLFTDTGVSRMLQKMFDAGARRERVIAYLAGAATHVEGEGIYRVGSRNHAVARRVLWKNDIMVAGEDVGGDTPRTLYLHIGSGRVYIKRRGALIEL